jgi:hypothetical protein
MIYGTRVTPTSAFWHSTFERFFAEIPRTALAAAESATMEYRENHVALKRALISQP